MSRAVDRYYSDDNVTAVSASHLHTLLPCACCTYCRMACAQPCSLQMLVHCLHSPWLLAARSWCHSCRRSCDRDCVQTSRPRQKLLWGNGFLGTSSCCLLCAASPASSNPLSTWEVQTSADGHCPGVAEGPRLGVRQLAAARRVSSKGAPDTPRAAARIFSYPALISVQSPKHTRKYA